MFLFNFFFLRKKKINYARTKQKRKFTKRACHLNRGVETGLNIILITVKTIYYNLKNKGQRATQQVFCKQTGKLEILQIGAKRADILAMPGDTLL